MKNWHDVSRLEFCYKTMQLWMNLLKKCSEQLGEQDKGMSRKISVLLWKKSGRERKKWPDSICSILKNEIICIYTYKHLVRLKLFKIISLSVEIWNCSVLRYLSVTIVTLYPVRHDRYMIVKVHSYVKVVLLIPSIVLWI